MVVEALVILIRRTSHIRVTRTIRPLFFLDCHYSSSVRRFMRQLVQSLKPVFQMLALLIFFMIIFSILGFYLFHTIESDSYFDTIWTSFISLFVLLTTANYPDVMMPAYNNSRWSCIFFIIYLAVELYFVMNLVLAVVYESFTRFEKAKLKKLFLHKRQACQYAFSLLVSKRHPKQISIRHFQGLLKFYKPRKKKTDVYLMFKTLNRSKTGLLTFEEFCEIYDITRLNWKKCPVAGPSIWSANFRRPLDKFFRGVHWFVSLKAFDFVISGVILANFIFLLAETVEISLDKSVTEDQFYLTWYNVTFVSVYLVELILKLLGLGPHEYFADNWNTFDFVVTLSGVCGLVLQVFIHGFAFIILLRLFRLLRLFKVSQTFRDVLGTLYILMSRLFSLSVAILMTYYIFAIIGIEIFHKFDMRDCCVNSSVEQYYVYYNGSINQGYYYLNDFHNILAAGVTLFELTVVNNWFIIMEGYAYVCSEWSRIYFMVFYLNMMVVMNVIVAFLLEAFLFRIQYRRHMSCQDIDEHAKIMIDVQLASTELAVIQSPSVILNSYYLMNMQLNLAATEGVWYRGERMRSKEDFSLRMYAEEVKEWIEEEQRRSSGRTTVSELDEFHTSVDRLNINEEQSNSAVNLT
ncbi:two pore calcium channel protein 1-like isoform X2 [Tubulanus polymorphus]